MLRGSFCAAVLWDMDMKYECDVLPPFIAVAPVCGNSGGGALRSATPSLSAYGGAPPLKIMVKEN